MPIGYGPLNTPLMAGSSCKSLFPSSVSNLNRMRKPVNLRTSVPPAPVQASGEDNQRYSRPVAAHSRVEHGPDTPAGAKHIQRLGEAVVVNDPGVDGEDSHEQDDVAAGKHHAEHLPQKSARQQECIPAV